MTQQIVIIGAGECGGRAALSMRERGFTGSITLIGSETLAPYERPPLSKDAILLAAEPKLVAEANHFAALDIDLRLGVSATGLDLLVNGTSSPNPASAAANLQFHAPARRLP